MDKSRKFCLIGWIQLIRFIGVKKQVMSLKDTWLDCPSFLQICYKRMRRKILLIIYLGKYHEEPHSIYICHLTPRCFWGSNRGRERPVSISQTLTKIHLTFCSFQKERREAVLCDDHHRHHHAQHFLHHHLILWLRPMYALGLYLQRLSSQWNWEEKINQK